MLMVKNGNGGGCFSPGVATCTKTMGVITMAKCLVGANGGGKVTVAGLSPNVLLTGSVAKVLQGTKEIVNIEGKLDVLLFGALNYSGGSPPYNPGLCYYWNGNAYEGSALNGTTVTFAGTPKLAYATISYAEGSSLGGNPLSTSLKQYTEFQNNQLKINGYAFKTGVFVVLGMK